MRVDSHHRFGCANLRTVEAVQLAPLYHPPKNRAIGEMPGFPGEEKAYEMRRGIRDVFRVGSGLLRDQAVFQQAVE
jgi:hypothetical protein